MRYFFGFLFIILLVVVTFVLVLHGFRGNKTTSNIDLPSYATTSTVMQFTVDGPITADQIHKGIRITVGQYANTIQVYQGYQNNVIQSKSYETNGAAYAAFLHALQLLNYTSGNKDPKVADPRGYCPQGERFTFQIISDEGTNVQNYWGTSCGGQGTFGGNLTAVQSLFEAQIPDYPTIAGSANL
ncbi:MAG TPA: hypothetical protein VGS08_04560 [Candidatus Saccharimonadales bacterium]|nr:hypothetical protein [Candidatus Saccharimonadales bacterium]